MQHFPSPSGQQAVAPLLAFHVDFDHPGHALVHLSGEVDHFNSWVISSLVEGAVLAGCSTVELDAHEVEFADSAIVSAIEGCAPALALSDCRVLIREPSRSVRRILELLDCQWLLDDGSQNVWRFDTRG